MDISIIIPTYNRLWSLPKAVESCFLTNLAVEVIVVDDGSTDGTDNWLAGQERIAVIRQENQGKDWAVNRGIMAARGKYVRFLDSDDWLLPFASDQLFNEAEKYGLDITCAGCQVYSEDEKLTREIPWTVCDDFLAQQLGECDSGHYSAYLFRKEFIAQVPHRQEYGALDDRKFMIETAMRNPKVGYIIAATFTHRVHQRARLQNTSGLRRAASHLALLTIYQTAFAELERHNKLDQRYKDASCNTLWSLAHWVARDYLNDARAIYNWVYILNPSFKPHQNLGLARCYQLIGFSATEKLLKLYRILSLNL